MEKISFVIPVYNVERFLRECIDSVLNQTYNNIEVILIDDGSTDNSGTICDEYKKKDDRVRVIHVNNGGVSNARNIGIENVSGDWIMFLDSDDYVDCRTCEILLDCAKRNSAEIAACSYWKTFKNFESPVIENKNIEHLILNDDYSRKKLIANTLIFSDWLLKEYPVGCYPWGKLIKSTLIKGKVFFPLDLFPNEDMIFDLMMDISAKKIVFTDVPLVHYRQVGNSAMNSKKRDRLANNKNTIQTLLSSDLFDIFDYVTRSEWNCFCLKTIISPTRNMCYLVPNIFHLTSYLRSNLDKGVYRLFFREISVSEIVKLAPTSIGGIICILLKYKLYFCATLAIWAKHCVFQVKSSVIDKKQLF